MTTHGPTSDDRIAWLVDGLHWGPFDVGTFIPDTFACYARVLHPVQQHAEGRAAPVRWTDVAHANNWSMSDVMQWMGGVVRDYGPNRAGLDAFGTAASRELPDALCQRLAGILGRYTTTPNRVFAAIWNGYGNNGCPADHIGQLSLPWAREYYVYERAITSVQLRLGPGRLGLQSPNLWWPADQAWCVATEIDFCWTYVGGSEECIAAIRHDAALETLPTHVHEGNFLELPSA